MLLPRYSLRTTLIGISLCAVLFLIANVALQGRIWAIVIIAATISFLGTYLVHGVFYLLVYSFGKIIGAPMLPARTNHGGIQTSTDQQYPAPVDSKHEDS